jgi:hypothetical protein
MSLTRTFLKPVPISVMVVVQMPGVSVATAIVTPPVVVRVQAMTVAVSVVLAAAVVIVVPPVMSLIIIFIRPVVRAVEIEPETLPVPKPMTAVMAAVTMISIMVASIMMAVASVAAGDEIQAHAIVQLKSDGIVTRSDRGRSVGGMGKSIGIG